MLPRTIENAELSCERLDGAASYPATFEPQMRSRREHGRDDSSTCWRFDEKGMRRLHYAMRRGTRSQHLEEVEDSDLRRHYAAVRR